MEKAEAVLNTVTKSLVAHPRREHGTHWDLAPAVIRKWDIGRAKNILRPRKFRQIVPLALEEVCAHLNVETWQSAHIGYGEELFRKSILDMLPPSILAGTSVGGLLWCNKHGWHRNQKGCPLCTKWLPPGALVGTVLEYPVPTHSSFSLNVVASGNIGNSVALTVGKGEATAYLGSTEYGKEGEEHSVRLLFESLYIQNSVCTINMRLRDSNVLSRSLDNLHRYSLVVYPPRSLWRGRKKPRAVASAFSEDPLHWILNVDLRRARYLAFLQGLEEEMTEALSFLLSNVPDVLFHWRLESR
jgi:hypothetical protein